MLYTAGLEHALLDSGVGFKLNWSYDGTPMTWSLPGLVFADDLVLLAEDKAFRRDCQPPPGHPRPGLAFNPKKSAVLQFSGDRTEVALVLSNGEELPRLEEYRYLGVILSTSDKIVEGHEIHLRQAAQPASCILRYPQHVSGEQERYCDGAGTVDNSCGGALLFEARVGALHTLDYRSRFDCAPETRAAVCRSCGDEQETIEHSLLSCSKLTLPPAEGTTLPQALGFLDAEGNRCSKSMLTMKIRLEVWWKDTKRTRPVPGVCDL
ncbi:hypothetical protein HPB50_008192 [Hyalomma asiaticum]|uniref:Uncharacterized protein n=1 Tax=Hyalomma asiaticum TaxID=266040 RepID=A0ACB7SCM3_HYAAI|nr:hypothetical protein HPB50_008192 [Hyalomma asiaticum]